MYYLYQHTKVSDGEVFYVGIGSLKRAYMKTSRSEFWHSVVDKHGCDVDIVRSFKSWEQACEWEKLFIILYGRRDNNTGSLVNMTDGGDGCNNPSEELRELKRSKILAKIGKTYDVYRISDQSFVGTFLGTKDCAQYIGCNQQCIGSVASHAQASVKGFTVCHSGCCPVWSVVDARYGVKGKARAGLMSREMHKEKTQKVVSQYSKDGVFIAKFKSGAEAASVMKINRNRIYDVANGRSQTYKGYIWKY